MNDLISRQAALDAAWFLHADDIDALRDTLRKLPSVSPMKHGKWIETEETLYGDQGYSVTAYGFECSVCGNRMGGRWEYCPNCGARMDADSLQEVTQEAVCEVQKTNFSQKGDSE